uniref:Uncharacterized protein n=1 Tax=Sipha flava TaxID=143950 RepID=A0A2S2QA78_9HEMI
MQLESSRSKFSFLMKLCFSKWSEMRQKPEDPTVLIFITGLRNTPLLFHRYEHVVSTVEYKVTQATQVTDEDWTWILWDMRDRTMEAIDPEAGTSVDTRYRLSGQSGTWQNPQTMQLGSPADA